MPNIKNKSNSAKRGQPSRTLAKGRKIENKAKKIDLVKLDYKEVKVKSKAKKKK